MSENSLHSALMTSHSQESSGTIELALPTLPESIKSIVVLLPERRTQDANGISSGSIVDQLDQNEELYEFDSDAALVATCLSISPFMSSTAEITFGIISHNKIEHRKTSDNNRNNIKENKTTKELKSIVDRRAAHLQCTLEMYKNALLEQQNWDSAKVDEIDLPFQYYYGPLKPHIDTIQRQISHIHITTPQSSSSSSSFSFPVLNSQPQVRKNLIIRTLPEFDVSGSVFLLVMNARLSSNSAHANISIDCLSSFVEYCTKHHLHTKHGVLIVLADDLIREQINNEIDKLNSLLGNWTCIVIWVRMWGPPALYFALTQAAIQHNRRCSLQQMEHWTISNKNNELLQSKRHYKEFNGWLESICAGVLLGTLKQLNVDRYERVPLIPLDVALNISLLALIDKLNHLTEKRLNSRKGNLSSSQQSKEPEEEEEHQQHQKQHRMSSLFSSSTLSYTHKRLPPPMSFAIAEPANMSLVYIMLGTFMNHYYNEEIKSIEKVMCVPNVIERHATLRFPLRMQDVWKLGPSVIPATPLLHQFASMRRRSSLLSCHINSQGNTNEKKSNEAKQTECNNALRTMINTLMQSVDDAMALSYNVAQRDKALQATSFTILTNNTTTTSNQHLIVNNQFDTSYYTYLLNKLSTSSGATSDTLQFVALHEVDWSMYIQLVAKTVAEEIAHKLLHIVQVVHSDSSEEKKRQNSSKESYDNMTMKKVNKVNVQNKQWEQVTESISTHSIDLPTPTRLFGKDFLFCIDRCSSPVLPMQQQQQEQQQQYCCSQQYGRVFNNVEHKNWWNWIYNFGMRFNGIRGTMTAGLTSERVQAILHQPQLQRVIYEVAAQEGVATDVINQRAMQLLLRIGDTQDHFHTKSLGLIIRPVFFKMFHTIDVNRGSYERLARLFERPRLAIVFVPLHRSYTDFIILTYALSSMTLPNPHIAAGEDFLHMGGLAEFMRASGAFFIRRSFRGDVLYTTLVREYVRQLLHHRQAVEFFIEGMRSRTGKTLNPKLGILKFILEAFSEEQTVLDDIIFIPVSISYDELPELTLYANELLGTPKPRENLRNFLKLFRLINHVYGSINVHFGENISLRDFHEMYNNSQSNYYNNNKTAAISVKSLPSNMTSSSSKSILLPAESLPLTMSNISNIRAENNSSVDSSKYSSYSANSSNTSEYGVSRYTYSDSSSNSFKELLVPLAYHITHKLIYNTVITAQSLVAAMITYYLTLESKEEEELQHLLHSQDKKKNNVDSAMNEKSTPAALTIPDKVTNAERVNERHVRLNKLVKDVEWFRSMILARNGNVTRELRAKNVSNIVAEGVTHLSSVIRVNTNMPNTNHDSSSSNTISVVEKKEKNITSNALLTIVSPLLSSHVALMIIANQLIHVFLDEAVVALIVTGHGIKRKETYYYKVNEQQKSKERQEVWQLPWREWYASFHYIQPLLESEFPQLSHRAGLFVANEELVEEKRFIVAMHHLQDNHITQSEDHTNDVFVKHNSVNNNKNNSNEINKLHQEKESISASATGGQEMFMLVIPNTPQLEFTRSFLTPHMEAIFIVLIGAKVFTQTILHSPTVTDTTATNAVQATHVINAIRKAALSLYNDGSTHHALVGCKETLQHYFEALCSMGLFTITHKHISNSAGKFVRVACYELAQSQIEVMERLNNLIYEINQLRCNSKVKNVKAIDGNDNITDLTWNESEEVKKISALVLREYNALVNKSRLESKEPSVNFFRRIFRLFVYHETRQLVI